MFGWADKQENRRQHADTNAKQAIQKDHNSN
jgi:hypothetical protein